MIQKMINYKLLAGLVILYLLNCSSQIADTGSGSEAGNGIVIGKIVYENGVVAAGVIVKLIPIDYNPTTDSFLPGYLIDTTDMRGNYLFDVLKSDNMSNVLAFSKVNGNRMLCRNIKIDTDTVNNDTDTLKATGVVKVILPSLVEATSGYVYIEGTDIYKKVASKTVYLNSVPAGAIPSIYFEDGSENELIKDSPTVFPDDTVIMAKVLLVVGFDINTIVSSDRFLKAKIEEIGLSVRVLNNADVSIADTAGIAAVLFSPTAGDTLIENLFVGISLPMLNLGPELFGDLVMTSTWGTEFDYDSSKTDLEIVAPSHPVAGGFSGSVRVYFHPGDLDWGKPGDGARKIAVIPGATDKSMIFCYEKGAEMTGINAPGKRGAFLLFGEGVYNLNDNGWQLFTNMIHWLFE